MLFPISVSSRASAQASRAASVRGPLCREACRYFPVCTRPGSRVFRRSHASHSFSRDSRRTSIEWLVNFWRDTSKQFVKRRITCPEGARRKGLLKDRRRKPDHRALSECKSHPVTLEHTVHIAREARSSLIAVVAVMGMTHVAVVRGILSFGNNLVTELEQVKDLAVCRRSVAIGIMRPHNAVALNRLLQQRKVWSGVAVNVNRFETPSFGFKLSPANFQAG